jgi:hypothetical protein
MFNKFFKKTDKVTSEFEREKYFFHDLINHTHALSLWVANKLSQQGKIDATELAPLYHEIKNMQALIQDHYQLHHKNLNPKKNISVTQLQNELQAMIKNFLGESAASVELKLIETAVAQDYEVYFPIWMRLLTNLVKNLSEHKAREIILEFSLADNGLCFKTLNRVEKLSSDDNDFEEKIQSRMREAKDGEGGLGIESIQYLTEISGGSFKFDFENGRWSLEIFIPHPDKKILQAA